MFETLKTKGNLTASFVGIMVAAIVGIAVTIPVINDTISTANLTGTTSTLVTYIPLMIAVVLLTAVVGLIGYRAAN